MTPFADAHDHVHIYPSPESDARIWRGFRNNPEQLSCVYVYAIVEYCQCSRLLVNSDTKNSKPVFLPWSLFEYLSYY